jgi:NAD-dependent deacetylase
MMNLPITDDTCVLVLTGAGVSAESGVPTFRDAGGLWEGHDVREVATPAGFARDPLLVWRFYSERRARMDGIVPNDGHRALVGLERRLGDRFLLVTQNIDGLHRGAGSERVIDLHGDLMRSRCTRCDRPSFEDRTAYKPGVAPMCGRCKAAGKDALLRPDIVWFGEIIDRRYLERIESFMAAAGRRLAFVAIGTSGLVHPAAGLVDAARAVGGASWLVNAEPPENAERFDHVVLGASGQVLPAFLG